MKQKEYNVKDKIRRWGMGIQCMRTKWRGNDRMMKKTVGFKTADCKERNSRWNNWRRKEYNYEKKNLRGVTAVPTTRETNECGVAHGFCVWLMSGVVNANRPSYDGTWRPPGGRGLCIKTVLPCPREWPSLLGNFAVPNFRTLCSRHGTCCSSVTFRLVVWCILTVAIIRAI